MGLVSIFWIMGRSFKKRIGFSSLMNQAQKRVSGTVKLRLLHNGGLSELLEENPSIHFIVII